MSATTTDDRWAGARKIIEDMKRVGAVPDSDRSDGLVQTPEFSGHKAIYLANLEGCLGGSFPALLAERDRLHQALDELAHAAREFSTEAAYKCEVGVEEEFVDALENAEGLLS